MTDKERLRIKLNPTSLRCNTCRDEGHEIDCPYQQRIDYYKGKAYKNQNIWDAAKSSVLDIWGFYDDNMIERYRCWKTK